MRGDRLASAVFHASLGSLDGKFFLASLVFVLEPFQNFSEQFIDGSDDIDASVILSPTILNSPAPLLEQPPPLPPRCPTIDAPRSPSMRVNNYSEQVSSPQRQMNFVLPRKGKVKNCFHFLLTCDHLWVEKYFIFAQFHFQPLPPVPTANNNG